MTQPALVGLNPWLPWPLSRFDWWTQPVRAERLAALRIGVALVLLWDIFCTYLPKAPTFFGDQSLGSPEVFADSGGLVRHWSLLRGLGDYDLLHAALIVWAVAATLLLLGWLPRLAAGVAWLLSISIIGINPYLHNSGDNVRTIALFYLMLSPCAAVWTLKKGTQLVSQEPVYVPAWPLRLLFIQMALIYFINGVYKATGPDWRQGSILHYVMANLAWTRFSYAQMPLPLGLTRLLTWVVLIWEFSFPLLVYLPATRKAALWLGVAFHVGTGLGLQLGAFPFYMLCLYLPLIPWENLRLTYLSRATNPACSKCRSPVNASLMPSCCITTKEMQSVSDHSLSDR
jgi:hypothetical protein